MRNFIRSITPSFLLAAFRSFKKKQINANLELQRKNRSGLTKSQLVAQIQAMGITLGDSVMVHASFSKIGLVNDGAEGLIDALLEVLGPTGNLLMPSSSNPKLQIDFYKESNRFDARNDASVMGIVSECLRKRSGALRSLHPTESVVCIGPDARFFTETHHLQNTAYASESPWFKLTEKQGKILFIGIGVERCTSFHVLEDAVENFKYPVYLPDVYSFTVTTFDNLEIVVQSKIHNPEMSAKRQCRAMIPLFKEKGVWKEYKLGAATCELVDAKLMLTVMLEAYNEKGITMYASTGL